MSRIEVRAVEERDREEWLRLRSGLWPGDEAEHSRDIERFFSEAVPALAEALVAEADGGLVGLAELSIRAYAEGCESENVGYLEGWFVDPAWRGRGVGRALIAAAEAWARGRGCSELASDADPLNQVSYRAHLGCGFEDAGIVRCFRKRLGAEQVLPS
jgi:aminoglycoside 6'-N-acetyltransferase I